MLHTAEVLLLLLPVAADGGAVVVGAALAVLHCVHACIVTCTGGGAVVSLFLRKGAETPGISGKLFYVGFWDYIEELLYLVEIDDGAFALRPVLGFDKRTRGEPRTLGGVPCVLKGGIAGGNGTQGVSHSRRWSLRWSLRWSRRLPLF